MRALSAIAVSGLLLMPLGAATTVWAVSSADEVCAPSADPCIISSTVVVDDGAFLDFGLRSVEFTGGGQIDVGAGTARMSCGQITTNDSTTQVFKIRGTSGTGSVNGGFFTLDVRRACSLDPATTCIAERNCQLGSCTVKTCSGSASRTCQSDAACDLGTCNASNRCSGATSVACLSDADCDLGSCSVNVCSFNQGRQCSSNSDCELGTCSTGSSGTLTLNRKVRADGGSLGEPGGLVISAAGDITVNKEIDARSSNTNADGGTIEIESGTGSIFLNGNVTASGGGASGGGEICILTGEDLTVNSPIDASGGDFDGGVIEIDVGRDALINRELNVNASSGEGFGGEIALIAGRDVVFSGSVGHTSNGSQSTELFGGDGGSQDYIASGDIFVGPNVNFQAKGAAPDGYGETVSLSADGVLEMNGDVIAIADGGLGGGGAIELTSDAGLTIGSTAVIDVSGGAGGGGDVDIFGLGNVTVAGSIVARAGNGGFGGAVLLDSGALLEVTGSIDVDGTPTGMVNGSIDIDSCNTNLRGTSLVRTQGDFGANTIVSREQLRIFSGAQLLADATGSNTILYRTAAKPPVIDGVVSPSANLILSETLSGCPVCGNAELEEGESCDDGNKTGGDGCDAECQDENCIAMTPGYPAVPLCNDDDGCTVDTCENGTCVHVLSCDDGIDCTVDTCDGAGACLNTPDSGLCDDSNPCTADMCNATNGCIHPFVNAVCDDGLDCTSNDVCSSGECSGVTNCPNGEFCNENTGICVGTTTTTTLPSMCGNGSVTPPETCDDGDELWSQGQYCDADCNELACGDSDNSSAVSATDALYTLRVAVGLDQCDLCVCDVDSSGSVTSGDALRLLRNAVGIPIELLCPACPS